MNAIVAFSNDGIIDPIMWKTFGVSVKGSDSAIGQFGTGLKYAIAVLVREGRSILIKSDGKEYKFASKNKKIRGKTFETVTCNNRALPFTTHLGSKWELWQAYRELYSNCVDEGGAINEDGDTVVYAELGDINHNDVFLDKSKKILSHGAECNIYQGESDWIYIKGIRAGKLDRRSMFTYDLLDASLTEDRTVKYSHQIDQGISNAFAASTNEDFINKFMFNSKEFYESDVSFSNCYRKLPDSVLNLVSRFRREDVFIQSDIRYKAIEELGMSIIDKSATSKRQDAIIKKASEFCELIGHKIRYPVLMSCDLGSSTLAIADRKKQVIYLSDTVLDQGVKQVAATLIEENLHIYKMLDDCTYEMQSFLFDKIVTMGEELTGEIL